MSPSQTTFNCEIYAVLFCYICPRPPTRKKYFSVKKVILFNIPIYLQNEVNAILKIFFFVLIKICIAFCSTYAAQFLIIFTTNKSCNNRAVIIMNQVGLHVFLTNCIPSPFFLLSFKIQSRIVFHSNSPKHKTLQCLEQFNLKLMRLP